MEDWPSTVSELPLHCLDVVTYNETTQEFRVWMDENSFRQECMDIFGQDFTDTFKSCVGSIFYEFEFFPRKRGTAFIVNVPQAGTLSCGDSKIKALLLTSAHVFTNPFDQTDGIEFFFTLAPSFEPDIFYSYSKYKVVRLFQFEPMQSNPFFDPITGNKYMLPDDVEVIAILENDPENKINSWGNDFVTLEFDETIPADGQAVVVVGYPAALNLKHLEQFAPIFGKHQKSSQEEQKPSDHEEQHSSEENQEWSILIQKAEELKKLPAGRVFSFGEVLGSNATCIAVTSSTWAGMSGGPLCIYSQHKNKLCFCGVYSGSAAVIFQNFISKILFALQGYPILLQEDDLPEVPQRNDNPAGWKFWLKSLRTVFYGLSDGLEIHKCISSFQSGVREILSHSETFRFSVEHNLAVSGGDRFTKIKDGLLRIDSSSQDIEDVFSSFQRYKEGPKTKPEDVRQDFIMFNTNDKGWEYIVTLNRAIAEMFQKVEKLKNNDYSILEKALEEEIKPYFKNIIDGWNIILKKNQS